MNNMYLQLTVLPRLHHVINELSKATNNRLSVGGTLCDLKKAFDCVNRGTLVNILELHIS
jgi:hypothetical protein